MLTNSFKYTRLIRCVSVISRHDFITTTIMNNSKESFAVLTICKVANVSSAFMQQFPNRIHERNQIAMIVFNCYLNDIIKRNLSNNNKKIISTQRQSLLLRHPTSICRRYGRWFYSYTIFRLRFNHSLSKYGEVHSHGRGVSSSVSSSWIVNSNSIGNGDGEIHPLLHPFHYQTKVAKKRLLAYVCGHGLVLFSAFALSVCDKRPMKFYVRRSIVVFLVFTGFAYTRIYLAIQKLLRSEKRPAGDSDGNHVKLKVMKVYIDHFQFKHQYYVILLDEDIAQKRSCKILHLLCW